MSAGFQDQRWQGWHLASAMWMSSYCLARGRYELALELWAIGTEWYEREVANNASLGDTNDYGKPFRQFLEEFRQRLAEFPLLLVTRSRLLETLNGFAGGIDRNKLKAMVKHEGSSTFGVICNQLARGGWLRQEKIGKKYTVYPESTAPVSDELFVSKQLRAPEENDRSMAMSDESAASFEIPEGYELVESDPIVSRPMTPELQQIVDDARQAGYYVQDDHANGGAIIIRPYFEYELDEDFILHPVPKPCGVPLIQRKGDRGLPKGLTILPDHTAHRADVKPWLAEDITDYAAMRSVLGLEPRPATQPDQSMQ
jgi:hypothetical protein